MITQQDICLCCLSCNSLKIMTAAKTERIARFAFDFAVKNNRKVSRLGSFPSMNENLTSLQRVTAVHKANIMKLGDGLFLNTCRRVAEEYKDQGIGFNDMIVDNTFANSCSIELALRLMCLFLQRYATGR